MRALPPHTHKDDQSYNSDQNRAFSMCLRCARVSALARRAVLMQPSSMLQSFAAAANDAAPHWAQAATSLLNIADDSAATDLAFAPPTLSATAAGVAANLASKAADNAATRAIDAATTSYFMSKSMHVTAGSNSDPKRGKQCDNNRASACASGAKTAHVYAAAAATALAQALSSLPATDSDAVTRPVTLSAFAAAIAASVDAGADSDAETMALLSALGVSGVSSREFFAAIQGGVIAEGGESSSGVAAANRGTTSNADCAAPWLRGLLTVTVELHRLLTTVAAREPELNLASSGKMAVVTVPFPASVLNKSSPEPSSTSRREPSEASRTAAASTATALTTNGTDVVDIDSNKNDTSVLDNAESVAHALESTAAEPANTAPSDMTDGVDDNAFKTPSTSAAQPAAPKSGKSKSARSRASPAFGPTGAEPHGTSSALPESKATGPETVFPVATVGAKTVGVTSQCETTFGLWVRKTVCSVSGSQSASVAQSPLLSGRDTQDNITATVSDSNNLAYDLKISASQSRSITSGSRIVALESVRLEPVVSVLDSLTVWATYSNLCALHQAMSSDNSSSPASAHAKHGPQSEYRAALNSDMLLANHPILAPLAMALIASSMMASSKTPIIARRITADGTTDSRCSESMPVLSETFTFAPPAPVAFSWVVPTEHSNNIVPSVASDSVFDFAPNGVTNTSVAASASLATAALASGDPVSRTASVNSLLYASDEVLFRFAVLAAATAPVTFAAATAVAGIDKGGKKIRAVAASLPRFSAAAVSSALVPASQRLAMLANDAFMEYYNAQKNAIRTSVLQQQQQLDATTVPTNVPVGLSDNGADSDDGMSNDMLAVKQLLGRFSLHPSIGAPMKLSSQRGRGRSNGTTKSKAMPGEKGKARRGRPRKHVIADDTTSVKYANDVETMSEGESFEILSDDSGVGSDIDNADRDDPRLMGGDVSKSKNGARKRGHDSDVGLDQRRPQQPHGSGLQSHTYSGDGSDSALEISSREDESDARPGGTGAKSKGKRGINGKRRSSHGHDEGGDLDNSSSDSDVVLIATLRNPYPPTAAALANSRNRALMGSSMARYGSKLIRYQQSALHHQSSYHSQNNKIATARGSKVGKGALRSKGKLDSNRRDVTLGNRLGGAVPTVDLASDDDGNDSNNNESEEGDDEDDVVNADGDDSDASSTGHISLSDSDLDADAYNSKLFNSLSLHNMSNGGIQNFNARPAYQFATPIQSTALVIAPSAGALATHDYLSATSRAGSMGSLGSGAIFIGSSLSSPDLSRNLFHHNLPLSQGGLAPAQSLGEVVPYTSSRGTSSDLSSITGGYLPAVDSDDAAQQGAMLEAPAQEGVVPATSYPLAQEQLGELPQRQQQQLQQLRHQEQPPQQQQPLPHQQQQPQQQMDELIFWPVHLPLPPAPATAFAAARSLLLPLLPQLLLTLASAPDLALPLPPALRPWLWALRCDHAWRTIADSKLGRKCERVATAPALAELACVTGEEGASGTFALPTAAVTTLHAANAAAVAATAAAAAAAAAAAGANAAAAAVRSPGVVKAMSGTATASDIAVNFASRISAPLRINEAGSLVPWQSRAALAAGGLSNTMIAARRTFAAVGQMQVTMWASSLGASVAALAKLVVVLWIANTAAPPLINVNTDASSASSASVNADDSATGSSNAGNAVDAGEDVAVNSIAALWGYEELPLLTPPVIDAALRDSAAPATLALPPGAATYRATSPICSPQTQNSSALACALSTALSVAANARAHARSANRTCAAVSAVAVAGVIGAAAEAATRALLSDWPLMTQAADGAVTVSGGGETALREALASADVAARAMAAGGASAAAVSAALAQPLQPRGGMRSVGSVTAESVAEAASRIAKLSAQAAVPATVETLWSLIVTGINSAIPRLDPTADAATSGAGSGAAGAPGQSAPVGAGAAVAWAEAGGRLLDAKTALGPATVGAGAGADASAVGGAGAPRGGLGVGSGTVRGRRARAMP